MEGEVAGARVDTSPEGFWRNVPTGEVKGMREGETKGKCTMEYAVEGGAAGVMVDTSPERFWWDVPLGEGAGHAWRRYKGEAGGGSVQEDVPWKAVQRG